MLEQLPPELVLLILVECGGSLDIHDFLRLRATSTTLKGLVRAAFRVRARPIMSPETRSPSFQKSWNNPSDDIAREIFRARLATPPNSTELIVRCLVVVELPTPLIGPLFAIANHPSNTPKTMIGTLSYIDPHLETFWVLLEKIKSRFESKQWSPVPLDFFKESLAIFRSFTGLGNPYFRAGLLLGSVDFGQPIFTARPSKSKPAGVLDQHAEEIKLLGLFSSFNHLRDFKLGLELAQQKARGEMHSIPNPADFWFSDRHRAPDPGTPSLDSRDANKLFRMWSKDFDEVELVRVVG